MPTVAAYLPCKAEVINQQKQALCAAISLTENENKNLNTAQKELLKIHFCLNHLAFSHIQWLVRQERIKVPKATKVPISNCDIPKCAACEFAKAQRRSSKIKTGSK